MKFSRKIFLALAGTASFTALLLSLTLYATLSADRRAEFEDSYVDHLHLLGKALNRIEESQSRIAMNAALFVQAKDHQKSLSAKELQDLAQTLGVEQINIDSKKPLPSQSLLGQQTTLLRLGHPGFIEIKMSFETVTQILREMIEHDEDNLSVSLIGPQNEVLGNIQRPDFKPYLGLAEVLALPDGPHWVKDRLVVLAAMPSANSQGVRLVASISNKTFAQQLQKMQWTLAIVFFGLLFLSWLMALAMTKPLIKKVESLRLVLAQITQTQNYSARVQAAPTSQDEIDELGHNLNQMLSTLESHQTKLLEAERDQARAQIAAQVAHDIRSPLMSMNMALGQIQSAQTEALSLLKSAVARVAGIVQKLAGASAKTEETTTEAPKLTLIEPLIAGVVNEHNVRKQADQSLKVMGLPHFAQVWSVVQVSELQTAISNLINNAFEAGAKEVQLHFAIHASEWHLAIKDNGKGIPAQILKKIFERSFSFGKKTGTGLGLFQAKAAIEWSGGRLEVQSEEGQGSTFTLIIPSEKKPAWIAAEVNITHGQCLYFVDDDAHVLNSWKEKCHHLGLTKAFFFSSMQELESAFPVSDWPADVMLVIDQNLGASQTGLDVIASLDLGKRAFLCTSEFDEKRIQDQVRKLKASLIPKIWIANFEIRIS